MARGTGKKSNAKPKRLKAGKAISPLADKSRTKGLGAVSDRTGAQLHSATARHISQRAGEAAGLALRMSGRGARAPVEPIPDSAIAREERQLRLSLHYFERQCELAAEIGKDGAKLLDLAWDQLTEAPPIRVSLAQPLLQLSDNTIAEWAERGILEQRASHPRRLSLSSVVQAKLVLEELREAGVDRDFAGLVLARLEGEELSRSPRFRESFEQARRGERGEWPKGF
jgi:hypothetical protein